MKYTALNDFIVLKKLEKEEQTSTFIVVGKKSALSRGEVISINKENKEISIGDIVLYPDGVGIEIDSNLLAIKEEHIICLEGKE